MQPRFAAGATLIRPSRSSVSVARTRLGRAGIGALLGLCGCFATQSPSTTSAPERRGAGEVTLISPRCVGATSCVLGHVTAAENGAPLSRVAVFLEPLTADLAETEPSPADGEPSPRGPTILALTDDQGVFTVVDPPPGAYRIAVYARSRKAEVRGLEIESKGTTMVPIRLVRGAI